MSGSDFLSQSQKFAYLGYQEREKLIRKQEAYWEKIFAEDHLPARKSKPKI